MDENLLIRIYDVGFGDCIYARVPDGQDHFHILIDCGTSAPADPILKEVLNDVCTMLPEIEGNKQLDLLVATHPHADHIKGFNPEWFEDVNINRIWLSAFMKIDHPQAEKTLAFQNLAHATAEALSKRQGFHLASGIQAMLARSIWNPGALQALREGFAQTSGITPQYPLYIARDLADRQNAEERALYNICFEKSVTTFRGFQTQGTCLRVLAPEWNIDKYYLGEGLQERFSFFDPKMLQMEAYKASLETMDESSEDMILGDASSKSRRTPQLKNISESDFRGLQNRLLYAGLAFSQKDDDLKNNTSAVLLLEWGGRRLLFTGDAEWQGGGVKKDRNNSTWDVMLHIPQVKEILLKPLDFLKVGHHGSHNGTPFQNGGQETVLEKILFPNRTHVVVSTVSGKHGTKNPVPYPALLKELGQLAINSRNYPYDHDENLQNVNQPQRTDLEPPVPGKAVRYVEVQIEPVQS